MASNELLELLAETGASARAAEALVRLESTKPRRAQALCRSFANGKTTVAQIETEIRASTAAPRVDRAEGAIDFDADERGARLKVQVSFESLADNPEMRERLRKAIGQFLGSVDISQVSAIGDGEAA